MQDFLITISHLKAEIMAVEGILTTVAEIHNRQLETITDEQEKETAMELEETMDKVQSRNQAISAELKKIDRETKAMTGKNASHEVPIRNTQYAVLLQSFSKTIQDFKQLQMEHQARVKERMTRMIVTVNPNATPMEIEKAILGEKVFAPQNMSQR
jgi:t-SNARE complex subunit (syntaxin)